MSGLKFWGIDRIMPSWRGSNRVRDSSKRETDIQTDTLTPKGMNVNIDTCFISDY